MSLSYVLHQLEERSRKFLYMQYSRSHLINPTSGTYHVCSRCVRKSFLFGIDAQTGKDFSHRRKWIEQLITELSQLFTISVYAYAIMSNHYHLVLNVEHEDLSDEVVADRWLRLCQGREALREREDGLALQKVALLADPLRLEEIRARLSSISWFMRFINEPLARMANREDECTGRFWEGRFKSQALLDEASILACMVYVDLNPVRAGMSQSLDECEFTSIKRRLEETSVDDPMTALGEQAVIPSISAITLDNYLELVFWTQDSQSALRRGLNTRVSRCLTRSHTNKDSWFMDHLPKPETWQRAIGSRENLMVYAASINQKWIRRRARIPPPTY
ncbi:hypothetical protein OAS78_14185 [Pseudomonadales bacterium]|nr:hypothetical protein [Pseudomonadales bacterium]